MTTPSIRKAGLQDLKKLQDISRRTFRESFESQNNAEDFNSYMEVAFSSKQLTKELSNAESHFFFMEDKGEVVGYLKLNVGKAQTETMDDTYLEIERIYIDAPWQGRGLGKMLLQQSIEFSKSRKKEVIWLGVWTKNPGAIAFYRSQGFVETGTHIYKIGNDDQLDLIMELRISS